MQVEARRIRERCRLQFAAFAINRARGVVELAIAIANAEYCVNRAAENWLIKGAAPVTQRRINIRRANQTRYQIVLQDGENSARRNIFDVGCARVSSGRLLHGSSLQSIAS